MIAIIPARGGSKGLPGKNIMPLMGKPLIAYTIEAALKAHCITKVILSTDDPEIERIAISHGATSPFLRPARLANDKSLAIDNYIFTIQKLRELNGEKVESFIVLQPTSPLRTPEDIDMAYEIFKKNDADSVISYTEEAHPISWHKHIRNDGKLENIFDNKLDNRQDNRTSYYPNGAIYIFKTNLILKRTYFSENTFAFIMSRLRSIDIDTLDDFNYAEYILRSRALNASE
jgi:CMP-N,N'-diacetyllegionaminic acid synthase